MTDGNLETKYCGEVIGDDVQLWTETGDFSEANWREKTWQETWKHDEETENKINQNIKRDNSCLLISGESDPK